MRCKGAPPNANTFISSLKACRDRGALDQGREIHAEVCMNGALDGHGDGDINDDVLGNTLLDMYAKFGLLQDARYVFVKLPVKSTISFNTLIVGYIRCGLGEEALKCFESMQSNGLCPSTVSYACTLKACGMAELADKGRKLHSDICIKGLETDIFVGNSLVFMYGDCGMLMDAQKVFDTLKLRDIVSWNALMGGYAKHGQGKKAVELLQRMSREGKKPDDATLVSTLKACSSGSDIDQGKSIHALVLRSGRVIDLSIGCTLMDMYIKLGNISNARSIFDKMAKRDVVTWNAMFAGYVQHNLPEEALQLFHQMENEGTEPNNITYVTLLKACSSIVALEKGKQVHGHIMESHVELDDFVGNALIDMYAKCGHLDGARKVFDEIPKRSAISWSAMISGYALRNNYNTALKYFEDMQREGLKPDDVAFVNLLSACSHKGLVQEGCDHFKSMIDDHGITPVLEHYTCMADLLSRAGHLLDAEAILKSMPCRSNVVGWISLLTNCKTHGKVEIARRCFDRIVSIDDKNAAAYVVMSTIYVNAGLQEEADKIEEMRRKAQAWKLPGKALVEVESQIHAFMVGDQSHPRSKEIYDKLRTLAMEFHDGGRVPSLESVQHGMSDGEKEDALCGHCEKLAIAFGLIATPKGTTIRVSKNLRVCGDCHNATKIISKIENREIIVRDSYRIHHFKNGVCSCDDYF